MNKIMSLEISKENEDGDGFYYTKLELPAEDYEIKDAYARIRMLAPNTYHEVTVLESPLLPELEYKRLDVPTVEELNFLAKRLKVLNENEDEFAAFQAVKAKIFDDEEDQIVSIKDAINLTYGLDEVTVINAVSNDKQLGEFVADNNLHPDVAAIPITSLYLLDMAQIGKLQREKEGGVFVDGKYVVAGEYELREVYNGQTLPEPQPPTDWIFRLEIAKPPIYDVSEVENTAEWIELPIAKEDADKIAQRHGVEKIEDCVYLGFESVIPQINTELFGDMQDFAQLNATAMEVKNMSGICQIAFKAVLSAEEPQSISEVLDIAENLQEYEFAPYIENSDQYFKRYLMRHLDTHFDGAWLESLSMGSEGEELSERLGATRTQYGYVSSRHNSLFEHVARHRDGIDPNEKFETIELLGQSALFTNGRIRREDVPEGLYMYELREGDSGRICAIEPKVVINHGGTVLVKNPIQFGSQDYIGFTEETSPNFIGGEMSLSEFMQEQENKEEQNMGGITQ